MLRRLAAVVMVASMVLVSAWGVGCITNDRWSWSQWLWWIPTPVAVIGSLSWLACALFRARGRVRSAASMGAIVALAVSVVAAADSMRLVTRAVQPSSLRLVCWNARWPGDGAAACGRALEPWAGRVMVISNPGRMAEHASTWMRPGESMAGAGTFLLTGPITVLEARPIVQGDDGFATLFRFTTPGFGETRLLAVDLPSNPLRPRLASLARFGRLVAGSIDLRSIDLIVGDFNCTRGSASVHDAFPGFRDTWTEVGQGWGASWPRGFPVLHIDLALASGRMRPESAELLDPGVGHHLLQVMSFTRASR